MAVPQITIRLKPRLKAAFKTYAAKVGMRDSELAKLLIVREKNLRHLASLYKTGKLPKKRRQARGSAIQLKTVTAHVSSVGEVEQFSAYADTCQLTRSLAGALLLEQELREKWLKTALKIPWERKRYE